MQVPWSPVLHPFDHTPAYRELMSSGPAEVKAIASAVDTVVIVLYELTFVVGWQTRSMDHYHRTTIGAGK